MGINTNNRKKITSICVGIVGGSAALLGLLAAFPSASVAGILIPSFYGMLNASGLFKSKPKNITDEQLQNVFANTLEKLKSKKPRKYKKAIDQIAAYINEIYKEDMIDETVSFNSIFEAIKPQLNMLKSTEYLDLEKTLLDFERAFLNELIDEDNREYTTYNLIVNHNAIESRVCTIDKRLSEIDVEIKIIKEDLEVLKKRLVAMEMRFEREGYIITLNNIRIDECKIVGRQDDIKAISNLLNSDSIVSINGIGGMGKSKLAKAVAASGIVEKDKTCWINFDQSFFNSLIQIANPPRGVISKQPEPTYDRNVAISKAAEYINELNDSYLLIIDNLEYITDEEKDYIKHLSCKVIITTRKKYTGLKSIFIPHKIKPLSYEDCIKLFVFYLDDREIEQSEVSLLKNIIKMAGRVSLVIELLAKLFNYPSEYDNVQELYNKLEEKRFDLSDLVEAEGDIIPEEFKKKLIILFGISKIENDFKKLHILKNMCILPSLPVPFKKMCTWLSNEYKSTIRELEKSSWLQSEDNEIVMHNLISETLKMRLDGEIRFEDCRYLIDALRVEIDKNRDNPERYKGEYLPFCVSTGVYFSKIKNTEIAYYYLIMARVYRDMSDYKNALDYHNLTINIAEEILGNDHPNTATAYNSIASVYRDMGNHQKALNYFKSALNIYKNIFGENHQNSATAYNNIAGIYRYIGEYQKALDHYNLAINIYEKTIGQDHPYTATAYDNIALVYKSMDKYQKALNYYTMAVNIREKALGKNHPDIANTYNNIACAYQSMRNYQKALDYFNLTINIWETVLGRDHPDFATANNNIAGVYLNIGDYQKALSHFNLALHIREKILGKSHPDTANTYNNFAVVYKELKDYHKALDYYLRSFAIILNVLGQNHPNTEVVFDNIKECYNESGKDMDKFNDWLNDSLSKLKKEK